MEASQKEIIYEFSPVIGVWIDSSVANRLKQENIDIQAYFKMIKRIDGDKTGKWRYYNLNKMYTENTNKENWKSLDSSCRKIISKYGKDFISSDFIRSFTLKGSDPNRPERFKVESLQKESKWFSKTYAELSKSPRYQKIVSADLPRYIISFVSGPTQQENLLCNLPKSFQEQLTPHIKEIYRQYIVKVDPTSHEILFQPHDGSLKINAAKNYHSSLFSKKDFENNEENESISYSEELHNELIKVIKNIIDDKIPNFIESNSMEMTQKRQKAFKAANRFALFKSSKSKNNEDYQDISFRIALDQLLIGNIEEAKEILYELLPKSYSKMDEVLFCLIHTLVITKAPIDEIEAKFYDLIATGIDYTTFYLIMYITKEMTKIRPFSQQTEGFIYRILIRSVHKNQMSLLVSGMCFEMMAGAALRDQRIHHATLLLYHAYDSFTRKAYGEEFKGHALRCIALVQSLITANEDYTKIFSSGMNNENVLVDMPSRVRVSWEELNAKTMHNLVQLLDACDEDELVMPIYFNLLVHCNSSSFAWEILSEMMARANKVMKEGYKQFFVNLPFLNVKDEAQCIPYGTPQYFGYDKEKFKGIEEYWTKRTRQTSNIWEHWGMGSNDNDYIYLVCNEPVIFNVEIRRDSGIIPLRLTKIHVVTNETGDKPKESGTVACEGPTNVVATDVIVSRHETDAQMPPTQTEFEYNSPTPTKNNGIVEHGTFLDLKMVPETPSSFIINNISFKLWDVPTVNIKMPQFKVQSINHQPTLIVSFNGLPNKVSENEIVCFTAKISNVGDAPVERLYCVHDNPPMLHISSARTVEDGIAEVPIITDPEKGIKPGEEIEIKCFIQGKSKNMCMHMIWYFAGYSPLRWRSYASQIVVESSSDEVIEVTPFLDPRDTLKLNFVAKLIPSEESLAISDKTISIYGVKYQNTWLNPFKEHSDYSNEFRSVILEEGEPKEEMKSKWRDSFIKKDADGGYLLYDIKEPHNEEEEKEKKEHFLRQHQISLNSMSTNNMRFNIECASRIEMGDEPSIIVPVKLTIVNISNRSLGNVEVIASPTMKNYVTNPQVIFWIGQTTYLVDTIEPGQEISFNFEFLAKHPDKYNVSSFIVICHGVYSFIPFKRYVDITY